MQPKVGYLQSRSDNLWSAYVCSDKPPLFATVGSLQGYGTPRCQSQRDNIVWYDQTVHNSARALAEYPLDNECAGNFCYVILDR